MTQEVFLWQGSSSRLLIRRFRLQSHSNRRRRSKGDDRFRWYCHAFIAGKCGSRGACASSHQPADQRAPTGSAADHRASPLTFSFDALLKFLRCYRIPTDTAELYSKVTLALEFALLPCGNHRTAHWSARFQYGHSVDTDGLGKRSTECVADTTGLGTKVLGNSHGKCC